MAAVSSPSPWGKINEEENERLMARRKTRKRIIIIAISSVLLVAITVSAVVGVVSRAAKDGDSGDRQGNGDKSIYASIKAICDVTLYPDSCYSSLAPLVKSKSVLTPQDVYKLSVQVAINELSASSEKFLRGGAWNKSGGGDPVVAKALESCDELLSLAMDHLNDSLSVEKSTVAGAFDDLKTWLSAAGTFQETCIDGFENVTEAAVKTAAAHAFSNVTQYTSNSLAIMSSVVESISALGGVGRRRRLMMSSPEVWLSSEGRRLLQAKPGKIKADVVVAKDGSGKYKRIKDALKDVPKKSKKRFVIYVKKGVYNENVRVEKNMWNVMMIGDGMDATIVSANLNFVDGTPTFQSATFAVFGKGFIARDMGFQNTAGAAKHQAVALMSTADQSVFYRCKMDGFQDTLYAHSNRQFYKDCTVYGTVDFIFGNSAVVLQNCRILPRKPMHGQQDTITAQGKSDPNHNTGISIQNCTVSPLGNLTGVNTFLGRPWKNYSTTVFMQSELGGLIHPSGWMPWVGTTAPNTIFYAEFQNWGPGAVTKNRVKWRGLRLNLNARTFSRFTVKPFINGDRWLPAAGVPFKAGL
ncbi:PREDICTED: probable pectinesterase/pectinesterase inhibitor 46 [Ipomoea nil]|uniref:probable pectinesterase/pectinesterase inhibitor 46 n=1 Tax=Ipomoea nil TaxID=35883 RepID=UPI00090089C7|nr:PREDICTED: probable pectinesterase/pectinesterase inhibitor 46 [Ipomoea nil]